METNTEVIKRKKYSTKNDLEVKAFVFLSTDSLTKIDLLYSGCINHIIFKGTALDQELIKEIDLASNDVKKNMSIEYTKICNELGIKFK